MILDEEPSWIENQEKEIEKEIKSKKIKNRDSEIMRHILFLLVITFFTFQDTLKADLKFTCPGCKNQVQYQGIWGNTWTCPNSNCGYENYESIRYCGLCGTDRYRDQ